jgi:MFS family permease
MAMSLMVIGYPLGAFLGGLVAAQLLKAHDWRSVFLFGGTMTAICLPLVWFLVPETPAWLMRARPPARWRDQPRARRAAPAGDRRAAAASAARAEGQPGRHLQPRAAQGHADPLARLCRARADVLLHPQDDALDHVRSAVRRTELHTGARRGVLAYANLGGAIGGAAFGWFMHRFGIKQATLVALALSVLLVARFGFGANSLMGWTLAVVSVGLFTNSAIVGFYTAFAAVYPTRQGDRHRLRAQHRPRGAALSPYLAGTLFKAQLGLMTVSVIMAAGSLLALALMLFLPLRRDQH